MRSEKEGQLGTFSVSLSKQAFTLASGLHDFIGKIEIFVKNITITIIIYI